MDDWRDSRKRIHSRTRAHFLFGLTSRLFTPDSGVLANQQRALSRDPPRFVDAANWLQFNRFPARQSALLHPRTPFLVTRVITKSKHTLEAELTGKTPRARGWLREQLIMSVNDCHTLCFQLCAVRRPLSHAATEPRAPSKSNQSRPADRHFRYHNPRFKL